MSIKRGYVADQNGRIKQSWKWATDDPPSPYPDILSLEAGDVVVEDTETSPDDWQAFQRSLSAYYFADGARVAKQTMALTATPASIAADGIAEAIISGIPAGATVITETLVIENADGQDMPFTTDLTGEYHIRVEHPHYLPGEVIVDAT